jgi:hypothetical protein
MFSVLIPEVCAVGETLNQELSQEALHSLIPSMSIVVVPEMELKVKEDVDASIYLLYRTKYLVPRTVLGIEDTQGFVNELLSVL